MSTQPSKINAYYLCLFVNVQFGRENIVTDEVSRTVGNFGTNLIDWYDLSDVWQRTFRQTFANTRILVVDLDKREEAAKLEPEVVDQLRGAGVKAFVARCLMG